MYTHLKKTERKRDGDMYNLAKLICSFINPTAAEQFFSVKPETVENTGFYDDLKNIDPKFDKSSYEDIIE